MSSSSSITSHTFRLTLPFDLSPPQEHQALLTFLHKECPSFQEELFTYQITQKSLDARGARLGKAPVFHYQVMVVEKGKRGTDTPAYKSQNLPLVTPPVIVGAGPAGLFCAYRLAQHGIKSVVIEQGSRGLERMHHIANFWKHGILNERSNVCFGEGGAGLYSDGKLITRIKSPLIREVMQALVDLGAPSSILYLDNPHLGSNKIRGLIELMTNSLMQKGVTFFFNTQMEELLFTPNGEVQGVATNCGKTIYTNRVILATGHSANNIYQHLADIKVPMVPKDFAIGLRIEHPRTYLDQIQLGKFAPKHPKDPPGPARYRLRYTYEAGDENTSRGNYSFCMCPGGIVLNSSTHRGKLVSNGMSNSGLNAPWSNAALVTTVSAQSDCGPSLMDALHYQEKLERKFFDAVPQKNMQLPAQTIRDFLSQTWREKLPTTSTPGGVLPAPLHQLLPTNIYESLSKAILHFDHLMPGFAANAVLMGPETRTSAPLTIVRDKETFQSPAMKGLYPAGEGAGYAGGITSSAVDGMKIADRVAQEEQKFL